MRTVLIPGGSGLIGGRLTELLIERGDRVKHLSRSPRPVDGVEVYQWDIASKRIEEGALSGVDAIVHLAGAEIMDKRTLAARQRVLVSSRVDGIALLRDALVDKEHGVQTFVGSSAQGFYVPNLDRPLTEGDEADPGWIGQLCRVWEEASEQLTKVGVRVVINRIGLVLSARGGGLPMMLPPFRKGFAPHFGRGTHMYPWIHVDDMCRMILHELDRDDLRGTYNAAAPHPVHQRNLNRAIAGCLGRKVVPMRVPRFVLKVFLGDRARLLADSWQLSVERILDTGFEFRFPHIEDALSNLLG